MTSMDFGSNLDGSSTFVSPYWPLVVAHRIDQGSPLYSLAPRDMQTHHFEVALLFVLETKVHPKVCITEKDPTRAFS